MSSNPTGSAGLLILNDSFRVWYLYPCLTNTSFVLPRSSCVSGRVPCPDGAISVPVHPPTALPLPATRTGNVAIFGGKFGIVAVPKALQDPCSSQNIKRTRPIMTWKEKGTTRSEQKTIICLKLLCILIWTLALSQVKRNWKRLTLSPKSYKNPCNSQIMKMDMPHNCMKGTLHDAF